jgi:hypothetical protein
VPERPEQKSYAKAHWDDQESLRVKVHHNLIPDSHFAGRWREFAGSAKRGNVAYPEEMAGRKEGVLEF